VGYRTALLSASPLCPLSAEVHISGGRPAAKPACGTPRAERSADASFPSTYKGAARRRPWLASPRTRTRPCGFSRQGRGKRLGEGASCAASSRSPRSPKETHSSSFADRRTRVCGKQQRNNQTIPVAAGRHVGTPVKVQQFSGFAAKGLCLRVVPTVGIAVGTLVGITVGTRPRHTQPARNRLMRCSTSARGRPRRLRLISISRCASGRRGVNPNKDARSAPHQRAASPRPCGSAKGPDRCATDDRWDRGPRKKRYG
jgi:hypothetical protein